MAKRGDGVVTDFRQLNEITLGSSYPLPFTSDILEHLASANYITAIDLKQGFYQITMGPADAYKTAFTAPSGCYQYKRMVMGFIRFPDYLQ